MWCDGL